MYCQHHWGFPQAPYRWRHANLEQIRNFLKCRLADGTYTPVMSAGLEELVGDQ